MFCTGSYSDKVLHNPQNRRKHCPNSKISILGDIQTEQQKTTGDLSCLNAGLALRRGLDEVALEGPF